MTERAANACFFLHCDRRKIDLKNAHNKVRRLSQVSGSWSERRISFFVLFFFNVCLSSIIVEGTPTSVQHPKWINN